MHKGPQGRIRNVCPSRIKEFPLEKPAAKLHVDQEIPPGPHCGSHKIIDRKNPCDDKNSTAQ